MNENNGNNACYRSRKGNEKLRVEEKWTETLRRQKRKKEEHDKCECNINKNGKFSPKRVELFLFVCRVSNNFSKIDILKLNGNCF